MQSANRALHLPSLGQVVLSLTGLVFFGGGALLLAVTAGFDSLDGGGSDGSILSLAWVGGLAAVLMIPSLVLAFRRLLGSAVPARQVSDFNLWIASALMLVWVGVLFAGQWAARQPSAGWLLGPLQLLAVGLPLWWLVELGRRGLKSGSAQRSWGLLNFGLVVTPVLAMVVEFAILGFVLVLAMVYVMAQPGMAAQLQEFAQRLSVTQPDMEQLSSLLGPVLRQPLAVFLILGMLSAVMPVVEELLKPLGLWLFMGRRLSPAEGFVGGLLCGAAFALLESLTAASSASSAGGDSWAVLMLGRLGTGLLHIVTAGLMGRALAEFWGGQSRWMRLGAAYLGVVLLHGLWNLFATLMGLVPLFGLPADQQNVPLAALGSAAPFALTLLMVVLLTLLIYNNIQLNRWQAALPPVESIAPPPSGEEPHSQEEL